jgi:hypothetical protein
MKDFLTCLVAVSMSFALIGCEKSDEDKAKDAVQDATDAVKSSVDSVSDEVSAVAEDTVEQVSKALEEQTVEAGCAGCTYKMAGAEGCQLAIKVAGKPYIVTGVDVSAHDEGLCEKTKQASIAGAIEDGQAVLTKFEIQ